MDSDFMNNLANMIKSGNIPNDIKEKMNRIYEPKFTDKILIIQIKHRVIWIIQQEKIGSSNNSINPEMLQNLMKMFSNSSNNSSNSCQTDVNNDNSRK